MRLLKYEGYNISFEPELLALKVFKDLHDRDNSQDKSKFIRELGYIYFMFDPRSDFQYITDEDERSKAIQDGEGISIKVDNALQKAIDYYKSFRPTSALLLEDTRGAVDKLRKMLRDIDLDKEVGGKPVYTLTSVVSAIKQVPSLVKDLDEAEKTIAREMMQDDKIRGSAQKSMYEDL